MANIRITVNVEVTDSNGEVNVFTTIRDAPVGADSPRFFHQAVARQLDSIAEQMNENIVHRYGSVSA